MDDYGGGGDYDVVVVNIKIMLSGVQVSHQRCIKNILYSSLLS
jgi:hypothetical protein